MGVVTALKSGPGSVPSGNFLIGQPPRIDAGVLLEWLISRFYQRPGARGACVGELDGRGWLPLASKTSPPRKLVRLRTPRSRRVVVPGICAASLRTLVRNAG